MKRTRRWEFVKQDVLRLARLGQSDLEIALAIGLDRATVFRWRKSGKLGVPTEEREPVMPVTRGRTPEEWAKAVRESYALDATDEQLVDMAEAALLVWKDAERSPAVRFQAMREYRATVKQLRLVARAVDAQPKPDEPKRQRFAIPRRSGADPRGLLAVAK